MFATHRRLTALRDREAARLSRWFRESEAGWLFYGGNGAAWHVTGDEARRWEDEARAILAGHLAWMRHLELRIVAAAMVMAFVGAFALMDLPVAARLLSGGAALMPGLYLVRQATGGFAYHRRLRRWRADLARRLAASGRGGVPAEIEAQHRRYNLFRIAELGLCAALFGHIAWGLSPDFAHLRLGALDYGLIGAALAAHLAATRVDATHRRRKWLE